MIQFQNVSVKIKDKIVLNDISYSFPKQGIVIFKGEIGSGKTTILNLIANKIKPSSGSIHFCSEIKKKYDIFYNAYHNNLISNLTVKENIKLLFNHDRQEEVNHLLQEYQIGYLWNRTCNKLSSGELQKVNLIIAYVRKAKITLLDEPICNLDKKSVPQFFELIQDLSKGSLVLVCMHEEIPEYIKPTDIIYLESGKIEVKSVSIAPNDLFSRKNEVSIKKSIVNMFPFFLKKSKLAYMLFMLLCVFLIYGICSSIYLKTTSDTTLYKRGIQNVGPQIVDLKVNEEWNDFSSAQRLKLDCSFSRFEKSVNISQIYMTDSLFLQGKQIQFEENDIYISDYLYGILFSGQYDSSYFYPQDTTSVHGSVSGIAFSCLVNEKNRILSDLNFIVYETEYRKYLPDRSKEDYASQIDTFINRINSFYLNVYTTSNVIARIYADTTEMFLASGKVINMGDSTFDEKTLLDKEFYASIEFLSEYFNMSEEEVRNEKFLSDINGNEFQVTFRTLTDEYILELKLVLGYAPVSGIIVNKETYNLIYDALDCHRGEKFITGEESILIDTSMDSFEQVVNYLKEEEVDFLQKEIVIHFIQSRDMNQILFTSLLSIFTIIFIVSILLFIFFLCKKEAIEYSILLYKGYNKPNFFTLCFFPQFIFFLLAVLLSILLFFFTRIHIAAFFHMV